MLNYPIIVYTIHDKNINYKCKISAPTQIDKLNIRDGLFSTSYI